MEDEEENVHLARKEITTSSPAEEIPSLDSRHSQDKEQTDERESSLSKNKHHHQAAQSKTAAALTGATSSMTPASINYNVNIQFDPATPQAGRPTHLSLVVTEQKVGKTIKQFDAIHDKLMHLIIINSENLSHFAHFHP
jgi:hypothetical protein